MRLRSWQAALIMAVAATAAFFSGIHNAFDQADDLFQIVDNVVVHSIANIGIFFRGSTSYAGQGLAPLSGAYYRPIMTTVYSLLYTLFGANPVPFHVVQMAFIAAGAFVLFLVYRRCGFNPWPALVLALVFLLHPMNSQAAFSIPALQDALFFFFGITALWVLLRFRNIPSLAAVAVLLLLALLSKESGVMFVAVTLVYVFVWGRWRFLPFLGFAGAAGVVWYLMRAGTTAGFLVSNSHQAPIDNLDLGQRLLTAPSIVLFYLTKFVWPVNLASTYYWTRTEFSVDGVLVPLLIDIAVVAAVVAVGVLIRRRRPAQRLHHVYWFFALWAAIGVLAHVQILPLDLTANETWFRFAMAGVLGMIGVAAPVLVPPARIDRRLAAGVAVVLIALLGTETAIRGTVWGNPLALAQQDVANSPDNFRANADVAYYYVVHGDCAQGRIYAQRSVDLFPSGLVYNILGKAYEGLGDYAKAADAYLKGISILPYYKTYENVAALTTVYGDPAADKQFLHEAVNAYPNDTIIWFWLAYFDYRHGDQAEARTAITQAYSLAPSSERIAAVYQTMMSGAPLTDQFGPPACGA